ncbi:ATP-dependent RecD-like DNA helicase [Ideonella sp. 4Y16]|uniref:ATP-dependent DNA helicase n=1 Tax=Ideonella alba TaxID=2824118 RepID=UPI001B38D762|nr:ATP-dependent RecD-like DNA helicase [Ideonella alba]MBQ0942292.1 ATP-dependent RecD-like DNA helicase [Ideonella alba]
MTFHLNVRVAWHDNRWNGTVCNDPLLNSYCLDLERIRSSRLDLKEVQFKGRLFADIPPDDLPPCKAESSAFMSQHQWVRTVEHPYASNKKTQATHGHLLKTNIPVPPYSTFAVPFYWMLRGNQDELQSQLPQELPPDEDPPFPSPWVFSKARQRAICNLFFGRLTAGRSLVFFYTKSGHPLEEAYSRLVVGVGLVESRSPVLEYDTSIPGDTYPLWDGKFQHSIRPDGKAGFILPYHDYLQPTGDAAEDARRRSLLDEIAVVPEAVDVMSFSYAGELCSADVALSVLTKCLTAVRRIKEHGIAPGPWDRREEWLNEQIENTWRDRGAFPGTGPVLEALGMRLGTSLVLELIAKGIVKPTDDPWPVIDLILRGRATPPQNAYRPDIKAVANTWAGLSDERRALVRLLSRMSLSAGQAKRWLDPNRRKNATRQPVTDAAILANPYRIAECDIGDDKDNAISLATVDRGVMPDSSIRAVHPVEAPSCVESPLDVRRVRAGLVAVLRASAAQGDALLSDLEALLALGKLALAQACEVPVDWLNGNEAMLADEVSRLRLVLNHETDEAVQCLQLKELQDRETRLGKLLSGRAAATLPSTGEAWQELIVAALKENGTNPDLHNPRHVSALEEQAKALEQITTSKLAVLVGRAGTGKTTVLAGLLKSTKLAAGGILFLAPTGKARVRLSQKANANAMTVAQFLHQLKRYDGLRQRVRFDGEEKYRREKTVVIDECSMLTMDDLLATLLALDLVHVQRVILVGDPNQLPPIGVGRPFADLVAYLDAADKGTPQARALARLGIELRTADQGNASDTLKLASWFTREQQPADAEWVLSEEGEGQDLNDLRVCTWQTPADLYRLIGEQFVSELGLKTPDDVTGFNAALGLTTEGFVPFEDHDGAERFQMLSPVRLQPHGIHQINRWVQSTFRRQQLNSSRQPWGLSLGDEEIVWGDKVILTRNGKRDGWNGKLKTKVEDEYLANGEIGVTAPAPNKGRYLNVAFAQRPDVRFGFSPGQFSSNAAPLELAYALTVHKAQGSEFEKVFVVLPEKARFLSRELVYTALTRSKKRLVLLIQGKNATSLFDLSQPTNSETARRNTNLFSVGVRCSDDFPYAQHLVHRTSKNVMVQSKSELTLATYFACPDVNLGDYTYNRRLEGEGYPYRLRPDFSWETDAGELILWEHLGMLDREDYRQGWEKKKAWYASNGYTEGHNLFTSTEGPGLDMAEIAMVAQRVRKALDR